MKLIPFTTILLAFAMVATLSHAAGHGTGNAADGNKQADGTVIPRDFDPLKTTLVIDNRAYLEEREGFIAILKEIAKGSPELALSIWQDLLAARIYTTEGDLPLIDPATTNIVTGKDADTQISIRFQNDILISLKAMNAIPDQFRLWVPYIHESLHGLTYPHEKMSKTTDMDERRVLKAAHHVNIWAAVNYLQANVGKYNPELLAKLINKIGGSTTHWSYALRGKENDFLFEIKLALFLADPEQVKERCAFYVGMRLRYEETIRFELQRLEEWADYAQCPKSAESDYLNAHWPELEKLYEWTKTKEPTIEEVSQKSEGRENKHDLGAALDQCNAFATSSTKAILANYESQLNLATSVYEKVIALELDPTSKSFFGDLITKRKLHRLITYHNSNYYLDEPRIYARGKEKLNDLFQRYESNVQNCLARNFKLQADGTWKQ